jgi:hypothetical protein
MASLAGGTSATTGGGEGIDDTGGCKPGSTSGVAGGTGEGDDVAGVSGGGVEVGSAAADCEDTTPCTASRSASIEAAGSRSRATVRVAVTTSFDCHETVADDGPQAIMTWPSGSGSVASWARVRASSSASSSSPNAGQRIVSLGPAAAAGTAATA